LLKIYKKAPMGVGAFFELDSDIQSALTINFKKTYLK